MWVTDKLIISPMGVGQHICYVIELKTKFSNIYDSILLLNVFKVIYIIIGQSPIGLISLSVTHIHNQS